MKIKVKLLNDVAKLPKKAHKNDACYDMIATGKQFKNGYIEYGTSLSFEIPEGHAGFIYPRSSISKYDLALMNSVGVIDSGYRGEVSFRFRVSGPLHYEVGDKIGQILVRKLDDVEFVE